ncbi:Hypothetical predicted protein [Lecanosticta acicola]|uniref:BTB domain-containing protein n=1 Tax=Lecanosticta acicola TaxID=111012 RepID=A0AAI9E8I3_9PEZI|nr:Hypothetical predicted protein [Lecanosticta acicola]
MQTAATVPTQADQLFEKLECDRMIKISIEEENTPVLVPESTLRRASQYFCGALDHAHLGNGQRDTLKFPETKQTWKILLLWIVTGQGIEFEELDSDGLDDSRPILPLSRAWIAADKYLMAPLQDKIMLEIIRALESHELDINTAKEVFENTAPDSKLRRVAAEEVTFELSIGFLEHEALQALESAVGGSMSVLKVYSRVTDVEDLPNHRADLPLDLWREYMVQERCKVIDWNEV